MDHPTRVAVLSHTAALGGAELALLRLLEEVGRGADRVGRGADPARRGAEVRRPAVEVRVILFSDGPLVAALQAAGQQVEVLPLGESLRTQPRHALHGLRHLAATAVRAVPFALRLGWRLRQLRPHVIHTTSLKADLLGVPAAWIARRPLVWHVHDRITPDYLPALAVAVLRFLARRVPVRVIANSAATAATLPGVACTVVYPGLSPQQIGAPPAARPAPAPPAAHPAPARPAAGPPTIGILGRVSPTKGQLVFVRAAARVQRHYPDARFRVIGAAVFGEEDYARRVEKEAATLGVTVEFTGFVTEPLTALDDLTLCVHASPTPEPFGQVIVEAMARGVPVVATRGGGVAEICHDGAPLAWLVPPHDPAALARAILAVLDDPPAAAARAHAAWQSVTARFPIERTAAAITAVWESCRAAKHRERTC